MEDTEKDSNIPPSPLIFFKSLIQEKSHQYNLAKQLKDHGWAILSLDTLIHNMNMEEYDCLMNWEHIFSEIFQSSNEEKDKIIKFHAIQGQTMGYRQEGLREFIETRLQGRDNNNDGDDNNGNNDDNNDGDDSSNNHHHHQSSSSVASSPHVLPRIDHEKFEKCVQILWKILREIVIDVISCMAYYIGIDPLYFLELIDSNPIPQGEVSSTVLRICSYPFDINHLQESQISFGAHTDTSFITIGLFSSISGLEIQDLQTKSWISIEDMIPSFTTTSTTTTGTPTTTITPSTPQVSIFVGDVMQLLTGGFYTACVHRVRTYHRHPQKNLSMTPRISCPFIVRGRHKSKIRSVSQYQRYPSPAMSALPPPPPSSDNNPQETPTPPSSLPSPEAITLVELPDFEDLNMKLIHTLLDRKRQKCMKQNQEEGNEVDEWVLKSF